MYYYRLLGRFWYTEPEIIRNHSSILTSIHRQMKFLRKFYDKFIIILKFIVKAVSDLIN